MARMIRGTKRPKAKAPARLGENDKYFSKVVGKALEVLDLIKRTPRPLPLNELTNRLGMAKSSVFRILHTLEVAGYIRRNESGEYLLASNMKPWVGGHSVEDLVDIAKPKMWDLRRTFGETVSLGVLLNNHIEVAAVVESPRLIRMGNTVGRILPPHASSMGKAITAFQSEARREVLLRSYGLTRFTDKTITDEIQLNEEYARIRERGWAEDREETTPEGFCFGVPIYAGDEVVAAMSISVPEQRLSGDARREEIVAALRKAAKEISEEISR
ncbi:MAG TPA: IclR family transcriptional regulator [Acidobacteriota bacterium]|nr:IclR family transcriptional regulator [Acidobacteriota bacterium]